MRGALATLPGLVADRLARRRHRDDGRALLVTMTLWGRALAGRAASLLNERFLADPGMPTGRVHALDGVLRSLGKKAGNF